VNKAKGEVLIGERTRVDFSSIKSIDVVFRRATSDWPDLWTVRLAVNWYSAPVVGQTTDATDASIAAARIATLTAKKVRTL